MAYCALEAEIFIYYIYMMLLKWHNTYKRCTKKNTITNIYIIPRKNEWLTHGILCTGGSIFINILFIQKIYSPINKHTMYKEENH